MYSKSIPRMFPYPRAGPSFSWTREDQGEGEYGPTWQPSMCFTLRSNCRSQFTRRWSPTFRFHSPAARKLQPAVAPQRTAHTLLPRWSLHASVRRTRLLRGLRGYRRSCALPEGRETYEAGTKTVLLCTKYRLVQIPSDATVHAVLES